MHRNVIETIMGGVVLIIAVVFLTFAYSSSNAGKVSGYAVTAKFGNVSGINPGSDVRLSGIKVGSVVDTTLDREQRIVLANQALADWVAQPAEKLVGVPVDRLQWVSHTEREPLATFPWVEAIERQAPQVGVMLG
ncbi:MAG: MCE family protein, partial [Rhodospirillaceae bacterium]|nr:MCE family protein [Rhodospirillaceae bacterium]